MPGAGCAGGGSVTARPATARAADGRRLWPARLGLDGLDPERLERALAAQVGLLEALAPELEPLPRGLPPQAPVWRP
ncbi:hypothetical protein I5F82_28450 [Pseudomonas aeruginosa]|nr:hypothetical protein [Pseudomonas aeruginosa]